MSHTNARKPHAPIRCRRQRDTLTPHRLREHLGRQHPPDRSITDPIRRRKQIYTSESKQQETTVSRQSSPKCRATGICIRKTYGETAHSPNRNPRRQRMRPPITSKKHDEQRNRQMRTSHYDPTTYETRKGSRQPPRPKVGTHPPTRNYN